MDFLRYDPILHKRNVPGFDCVVGVTVLAFGYFWGERLLIDKKSDAECVDAPHLTYSSSNDLTTSFFPDSIASLCPWAAFHPRRDPSSIPRPSHSLA